MATSLDKNTYALTWSEEDGFSFFMPENIDADADLPDAATFLAAIAVKSSDEVFVNHIVEEFIRLQDG